jgi:hypothetical protein
MEPMCKLRVLVFPLAVMLLMGLILARGNAKNQPAKKKDFAWEQAIRELNTHREQTLEAIKSAEGMARQGDLLGQAMAQLNDIPGPSSMVIPERDVLDARAKALDQAVVCYVQNAMDLLRYEESAWETFEALGYKL